MATSRPKRKSAQGRFYGENDVLAEQTEESGQETAGTEYKSDSSWSFDSAEEDAFARGEDLVQDKYV